MIWFMSQIWKQLEIALDKLHDKKTMNIKLMIRY